MTTLAQGMKARSALTFLLAATGQQKKRTTRSAFLLYLASIAPKPATIPEIADAIDVDRSQLGRVARSLHKIDMYGEAGMDLINIDWDHMNTKTKLITLNAKGREAVADLMKPLK